LKSLWGVALALACVQAGRGQLNVSGNFPVLTLDVAPANQSIAALNAVAQVALAGQAGAGVALSGTWTATLTPELSFDGGATWVATFFKIPNTAQYVATVAGNGGYTIVCLPGVSHARVRASAYTSGTVTAALRVWFARFRSGWVCGFQSLKFPTTETAPPGSWTGSANVMRTVPSRPGFDVLIT